MPSAIRDRIVDFRRVLASSLLPDPRNWRRHPKNQADALKGVLAEIGYADALLARETPEGLRLIDGHLRRELTPDQVVPVLVLDVDEGEAATLLATLDPLSAMAQADAAQLDALLKDVKSGDAAVQGMLAELAKETGLYQAEPPPANVDVVPEQFMVMVTCDGEDQQAELLERLTEEGFSCRALVS